MSMPIHSFTSRQHHHHCLHRCQNLHFTFLHLAKMQNSSSLGFVPLSAVCLDDVPSLGHPHPHHRQHYHHHRSDSALFSSRHEPNNGQFIKSNYTPNILRLPFNENSNKFWQTFGFRCTELCKFCKLSLARVQWKCLRISKQYLLLLLNKAS